MPDDLATAALQFRSRLRSLLVAAAETEVAGGPDGTLLAGRPQAIDPPAVEGAEMLPSGALMLVQPPLAQDDLGHGRPSSEPPASPQEWRLYARPSPPPGGTDGQHRTPFSLDGVLSAEAPPESLVPGAFRLILEREPDLGGLDHHLRALRTGQPAATMMRSLLGSAEALERGEQLLLVRTAAPPSA